MNVNERFFAVIPCAGQGTRAAGNLPKQYRAVAGRPLLYYALAAFSACAQLTQILLVIAKEDRHFDRQSLSFSELHFAVRRCGGPTRQVSVLNGINALAEFGATDHDWVMVHDAARPGITPALIHLLMEAAREDPVGGIVALPVTDTLKRVDGTAIHPPRIVGTESRENLWLAQTPQMFRRGLLRTALTQARQEGKGAGVTDEAAAVEQLGYSPQLVLGHWRNFKVTYPEDFEIADAMLNNVAKPA